MQAIQKAPAIGVEEYLAGELQSQERREYLGGSVYAMAGTSVRHNLIAGNIFSSLRAHLKGKPCQVLMSDVKVRLQISEEDVFYYPDVMVACHPKDTEPYFKRYPQVLIEVLSPETESIDRREKFLSYIQIETLMEYVLVAQDKMELTVFRRANKWQPEIFKAVDSLLSVNSLGFSMPLNLIYEGIKI